MRMTSWITPLTLALLAALSTPTAAQDGLAKCRAITDTAARLACYDALPLPSTGRAKETPQEFGRPPQAAQPPARAQETPQQFGNPPASRPIPLDEIQARVVGHFGGWQLNGRVRLDNGQVWQFTEDNARFYSLENPKIVIRRGLLDVYYFNVEGDNRSVRVRHLE